MEKEKHTLGSRFSPYLLIILSFLVIILIGAILFVLPISNSNATSMSFADALFLSTSAVTVTGFSPFADIGSELTMFGKIVLVFLVQIGGLGIITLSVFVMILLGVKIGISDRVLIRENLNFPTLAGVVKILRQIMIVTFSIELIGFVINLFAFIPLFPTGEAIGLSLFYSISFFNNAVFIIIPEPTLAALNSNPLYIFNSTTLIALGGLGYIVLIDIIKNRSFKKLMIHSKIVLAMSLLLWVLGTLLLKLGEIGTGNVTWLDAFRYSVTSRTTGIDITQVNALSNFSLLTLMFLMFIGGSPTSTGGGIKTTTFFVLSKTAISNTQGSGITIFKRRISEQSKKKAYTVFTLMILLIFIGTGLLLLFDDIPLGQTMFKAVSALTNTGYSLGYIQTLSLPGRLTLILLMFIGRVGPLTFITLFNRQWYKIGTSQVAYLEEKIIIG